MSAVPSPSFGSLLRHHRLAAGLTQEELAERAGVSPRAIIALELGERRRPYRHTLALLTSALQLSPAEAEMLQRVAGYATPACDGRRSDAMVAVMPLVGRSSELAAVECFLASPAPPVLMVAGEPGIGKTRLLQEAARLATAGGFTVLQGGGHRRTGQEPYAPLVDTLAHSLEGLSPPQVRAALAGCGWLSRLLPELMEIVNAPMPAGALPPDQERRLVFAAVGRFLANRAGGVGTLLILDDLQWASPDGLDLLASLFHTEGSKAVRMLGAFRDTEVGQNPPFLALLSDLAEHHLVERLPLDPLEKADALALLDSLLQGRGDGDRVKQRIAERAGGVPFFLVSCVHGLDAGDQGEGVPWTVAQSIRQRVASLPQAAQEALGIAAVVGRVVPRNVLVGVAIGPEDEILAAFDATCRAGLLEEVGGDAYQFVHDIIREVVEHDLGSARRSAFHRRVAEVLERSPAGPSAELVAFHYSRSDVPEKAAPYLEEAGDRAQRQYAHTSAAAYFRDLVKLLDEPGQMEDLARAYEKLGVALRLAGDCEASLPALERAIELNHLLENPEGEWRSLAQIGWVHAARGTLDEGFGRIEPILEALDHESQSSALAALYVALTRLCDIAGRHHAQLAAAERAAQIAAAVGDMRALATAQAVRGNVLVTFERYGEGVQVGEDAVRLAEECNDLLALNVGLTTIGYASLLLGELARARAATDRAVVVADQWGDPEVMLEARCFRATVALHTEEWTLARADGDMAVSLGRRLGLIRPLWWALVVHATCCARMGEWDTAARHLEECLAITDRDGDPQQLCFAQTQLAEHDLLTRRPELALARLEPLADKMPLRDRMMTWFRPALAWAYLEVGELVKAEDEIAHAAAHARSTGNRVGLVEALRVQAMAATRRRRWAEATDALEEGVLTAQSMHYPYGEGRLLLAFGEMHAERGESDQAQERLKRALTIFKRLGAQPYVEQAQRALNGLPPTP